MHIAQSKSGPLRRLGKIVTLGSAAAALGVTGIGVAGAANAAATSPTSAAPAAASASAAPLSANWYASAPYFMPDDNNPPDISQVMAATGQKTFQLAFILAGSGCTATWDGTTPIGQDAAVASAISTIRAAGGDVSVSQGGYSGTKLGEVCSSPQAEATAMQAVIDTYSLHAIDFDLEEPEYENTTAVDNELGAAQILQQDNPGLYVSITMPGTSSGTGYFGENVLKTAKGLGFTPANFSIMPFDNGINGAAQTEAALTAFNGLLQKDMGWDAATAWSHEGFSGMDGRSDSGEMFTTADFDSIRTFALSNGMARFTFWSVNRDRPCPASESTSVTWGDCSSTDAPAWSYTAESTAWATNASVVTPPTSGGGTPPAAPQCAAAYASTSVYTGGMQVSYNGDNWTAQWWTQGAAPAAGGVWTDDGPCSGSATTPPTSGGGGGTPSGTCAAAWNSATAYVGGTEVSDNGHNWTAKWWTQNETPGTADVWTDSGACTS